MPTLRTPSATVAAAAASGLLLWLASPAVGAGWVAWVALVPVAAVALDERAPLGRLAVPLAYCVYLELLFIPALPFGLTEGQWGDPFLPVLVGDTPLLPVALLTIPLFGLGLWALRFGRPWGARGATLAVLVPALAWTALDFAHANLDPGGAWPPLFLSQAGSAPGSLAALAGPWLVTLAIVTVNYGIALALVSRRAPAALAPAAAVALALTLAPLAARGDAGGLRVGVVQPGYDTAEEGRPELRFFEPGTYHLAALDLIGDLGGLTRGVAAEGAEVVVWPEATMYVDPRRHPAVRLALRGLARSTGVALIVPYFDHEADAGATIAVAADGTLSSPRPKQRPMWFLGERSEGGDPLPLAAGDDSFGTLLGVDNQATGVAAELADAGAGLLASSTHDWESLAVQQRALSSLAAQATGLPLARADWRYGSALYDSGGDLVADAGTDLRRTALVADLDPGDPTPYARIGDVLGWLAAALAAAAWLWGRRRRVAPPPPAGV